MFFTKNAPSLLPNQKISFYLRHRNSKFKSKVISEDENGMINIKPIYVSYNGEISEIKEIHKSSIMSDEPTDINTYALS